MKIGASRLNHCWADKICTQLNNGYVETAEMETTYVYYREKIDAQKSMEER